jgi:hypothetical protein
VKVEVDRHSLLIDGQRRLIRSGSLHYFRLPAERLWRDRLEQFRSAGLNAVTLTYPWSYHSRGPGEFDFTDIRNVDRLHEMIEEAGLFLIARPGPYVCAELDMGGLPAWLLRDSSMVLRCRTTEGFTYSREFVAAAREWFTEIVPRFAKHPKLLLVQMENEYAVPGPYSRFSGDLADLLVRWFGAGGALRLLRVRLARRETDDALAGRERGRGQTSRYMRELYESLREFGVEVPISHNDASAVWRRQMDADLLSLDRHPVTSFEVDWRDDPRCFDGFLFDESALEAHREDNPQYYAELQAGAFDRWGGVGYETIRERLGAEVVENVTKAALAERATLWNYSMLCGGITWGYMGSPDVYSSYDCGAPIGESGGMGPAYQALVRLNEFLERYEEDLVQTERTKPHSPWCPEHLLTRTGLRRRFVFLRNASARPKVVPTPEAERSTLAAWETQIRVYDEDGSLAGVSPALPEGARRQRSRLPRFRGSSAGPLVARVRRSTPLTTTRTGTRLPTRPSSGARLTWTRSASTTGSCGIEAPLAVPWIGCSSMLATAGRSGSTAVLSQRGTSSETSSVWDRTAPDCRGSESAGIRLTRSATCSRFWSRVSGTTRAWRTRRGTRVGSFASTPAARRFAGAFAAVWSGVSWG